MSKKEALQDSILYLEGKETILPFEAASFLRFGYLAKMEPELETFRDNVDSWIKQIRREFATFSEMPEILNENINNIQHNYELIYELKDEIEELKQEINALKLIQIISLKQKMNQKAEETQQS